jgi:hypothetical protein
MRPPGLLPWKDGSYLRIWPGRDVAELKLLTTVEGETVIGKDFVSYDKGNLETTQARPHQNDFAFRLSI